MRISKSPIAPQTRYSIRSAVHTSAAERGVSTVTSIFFSIVAAAGLFYAYNVAPIYYAFYEFQSHMEQMVRVAQLNTDAEIRKKLTAFMNELQLPAAPENLIIQRDGTLISISLSYDDYFYITYNDKDYILQKFQFDAKAEGLIEQKRR